MSGAAAPTPGRRGGFVAGAAALALISLAIHVLLLGDARPLAAAALWLVTIAPVYPVARSAGVAPAGALGAVAAFAATWWAGAALGIGVFLAPVASYLLLLWFFGRTLRPGREPLVSAIARFIRGPLEPEVARYTRGVTRVWCAFFAAMAAASMLLAATAPLAAWSFFVNVLAYPLVALVFTLEYAYRRWRFPAYEHVPLGVMVRRIAEFGAFRPAPPAE